MWAFAKSLLLIARYSRRIAVSLETLTELYRLDLESRGINTIRIDPSYKPTKDEMTEVAYSSDNRDTQLDDQD
jgi:hypothetical protein